MQEVCKEERKDCVIPEELLKLWCMTYKVKGDPDYEGIAVVSAFDVNQAIRLLKAESMHNGHPDDIQVGRIDQVKLLAVPKLIMENYVNVMKVIE